MMYMYSSDVGLAFWMCSNPGVLRLVIRSE